MATGEPTKRDVRDDSKAGCSHDEASVAEKHKSASAMGVKLKKSATALGVKLNLKKDTTLACRYELKYRISESRARAIAEYIRPYLHPDRYAKLRPRYEYPITSLYLDSDNFRLARETLEGKRNRFKLRVRGYSDNQDSPCFFEIKRRISNVIVKSRARVKYDDVPRVLEEGYIPKDYETDEAALRQFVLYMNYIQAHPMVLVRYMRQAFEGDSDNRVRVTFDRQLAYNSTREPRVRLNGTGWQRLRLDFVVLEIKFTAKYPVWLSNMVKVFDLKQGAMSKYASSIQTSCSMGFCAPRASVFSSAELSGYIDG
jgi:hypothetical protein